MFKAHLLKKYRAHRGIKQRQYSMSADIKINISIQNNNPQVKVSNLYVKKQERSLIDIKNIKSRSENNKIQLKLYI
jgi:hypothetical protein